MAWLSMVDAALQNTIQSNANIIMSAWEKCSLWPVSKDGAMQAGAPKQ